MHMKFQLPRPHQWWPETCKPVSIVKLDEARLGLRFKCASGDRMTMPLTPATLGMIRPK